MDTFLTTAIIGTSQRPEQGPTPTGTKVDALSTQLPQDQTEHNFLLTAGARAIYNQAGFCAPMMPSLLHMQAEPEKLTPCSDRVAQKLLRIYDQDRFGVLLPEALQRIQQAQQRLPFDILIQSLQYGTRHKEVRRALKAVIGKRGHWLGQLNPSWHWLEGLLPDEELSANTETIWQEGTLTQRVEILQCLRTIDPVKARHWLEQEWKKEKAQARTAFLSTLKDKLSNDDEAFLTQALTDRTDTVRQTALNLLLRLSAPPTQRLINRAHAMLTRQHDQQHQERFIAIMPDHIDQEWKNDIAIIQQKSMDNDPIYWFRLALERVPPRHWEEHFAASPEHLIQAYSGSEWEEEIYKAWIKATQLHEAGEWYVPLIKWCINQNSKEWLESLFTLPPPMFTETEMLPLLEILFTEKNITWHVWTAIIQKLPDVWGPTLSQAFLNTLMESDWQQLFTLSIPWADFLTKASSALDPSCFNLARQAYREVRPDGDWLARTAEFEQATELIELRQQLLEEIQS